MSGGDPSFSDGRCASVHISRTEGRNVRPECVVRLLCTEAHCPSEKGGSPPFPIALVVFAGVCEQCSVMVFALGGTSGSGDQPSALADMHPAAKLALSDLRALPPSPALALTALRALLRCPALALSALGALLFAPALALSALKDH